MSENLVVIFGAGASFDSFAESPPRAHIQHPEPPGRPPLANHLFSTAYADLLPGHEELTAIIDSLRAEARKDNGNIERELQRLFEQATLHPRRHSQLMAARYYLKKLILVECSKWLDFTKGATNYANLADRIAVWRDTDNDRRKFVTYVTFNYDTLLEDGIRRALSITFPAIGDHVAHEEATVIKPHGSVGWHELLAGTSLDATLAANPRQIIERASKIESRSTIITDAELGKAAPRHAMPAIAIPLAEKSAFVCPPGHLGVLKNRLHDADKILVIGWRGTEKQFTDLLRSGIANRAVAFHIVAGNEADARQTWTNLGIPDRPGLQVIKSGHEGFSPFIRSDALERFLDSPPPVIPAVIGSPL